MKELLSLLTFDTFASWLVILLVFLLIITIPRLFHVDWLNGLLLAQVTLFFTSLTTIAGLSNGVISLQLGIHFFSVEYIFYIVEYALYGYLLRSRAKVLVALNSFFGGKMALPFLAVSILICIFNYLVLPGEGGSRIAYMTGAWYSFVKPFIQFLAPLSSIGVFLLLLNKKRRWLGYALLIVVIAGSVISGSKASFAISLVSSFLLLRDLFGETQIKFKLIDKASVVLLLICAIIIALSRLEVGLSDLFDRFFLFGEANLLTYFSDQPTAACDGLSMFAKMHRGWARLAGDISANNIDTLFGYALMIQAIGVNTFTGPNARLSAYALCNFPGINFIFLAIVLAGYAGLALSVFRRFLSSPLILAFVYPFLISSLSSAAQDFNIIMQDITYLLALLLAGLFLRSGWRFHCG